jgi:predicted O-methyltransferase YrrM
MNKILLIFPLLKLVFTKPSVVFKNLFHLVKKEEARSVVKHYGFQNSLPQIDILDLIPNLSDTVEPVTFLYGTSMPIDFLLLKSLAKKFNGSCDFFEIGTWRGESIACVAPNCNTCTSLSLGDEDMKKIGWGGKFIEVQRFFSKSIQNITHIEGNSRTFDYSKLNKKFDLIFVDGDHSYEGVKIDTQNVFKLLKDENSIIVWHDYAPTYEIIDNEVFAGILDGTSKENQKHLYHVSNTFCAIYTKQNFKTNKLDFPTVPNKKFKLTIEAQKI